MLRSGSGSRRACKPEPGPSVSLAVGWSDSECRVFAAAGIMMIMSRSLSTCDNRSLKSESRRMRPAAGPARPGALRAPLTRSPPPSGAIKAQVAEMMTEQVQLNFEVRSAKSWFPSQVRVNSTKDDASGCWSDGIGAFCGFCLLVISQDVLATSLQSFLSYSLPGLYDDQSYYDGGIVYAVHCALGNRIADHDALSLRSDASPCGRSFDCDIGGF